VDHIGVAVVDLGGLVLVHPKATGGAPTEIVEPGEGSH
jgi:hypothetical protein